MTRVDTDRSPAHHKIVYSTEDYYISKAIIRERLIALPVCYLIIKLAKKMPCPRAIKFLHRHEP